MIQSRKFLPRDIVNICSRYVSHPLFVAIDEACYRWEEQMQCIMLSPAEIFWHTANHLDTIREQQEDAMPMIERLATQHHNNYHRNYPAAEKAEITLAVTLIIISLANCLYLDGHYLYKQFADRLICSLKDKKHTEAYEALLNAYAAHKADITHWMQAYMPSDEWLSDEINLCLTPTETTSTGHFAYLTEGLNLTAIQQFENDLREICNRGSAAVVRFITDNMYGTNAKISALKWQSAPVKERYNELCHFGLKKKLSSFEKAITPKNRAK